MVTPPRVAIVDDDESLRESLPDLVRQLGFEPLTFASAEEFLASGCISEIECLVLDLGLPGMSGLDLHRELAQRGRQIPTIFVSARAEEALPVECLIKPFAETALLEAIVAAMQRTDRSSLPEENP